MASKALVHAQQSNTLTISQNWNALEVHTFHIMVFVMQIMQMKCWYIVARYANTAIERNT